MSKLIEELQTFMDAKPVPGGHVNVMNDLEDSNAKLAEATKMVVGARALLNRALEDQNAEKARNRELSYLAKEYARSPYSTHKSHFKTDSMTRQ